VVVEIYVCIYATGFSDCPTGFSNALVQYIREEQISILFFILEGFVDIV
jgi:hypothetical protein